LAAADPPPVSQWPRRMLFAIANPTDLGDQNLAPLDVEKKSATC
jgi:hypothetical protein